MRNLLRSSLLLLLVSQNAAAEAVAFDKTYTLNNISFHVACSNNSSLNTLTIVPAGLELDNSVRNVEIDGAVTNAEIADLNNDGSPEIYVFTNSAGSGSYGDVIAYSANNNKSLSQIYLPPLTDDKKHSQGYMGHDEFTIVDKKLTRRFPVYREGDTNNHASGGMRELNYQLVNGEASWILKLID